MATGYDYNGIINHIVTPVNIFFEVTIEQQQISQ